MLPFDLLELPDSERNGRQNAKAAGDSLPTSGVGGIAWNARRVEFRPGDSGSRIARDASSSPPDSPGCRAVSALNRRKTSMWLRRPVESAQYASQTYREALEAAGLRGSIQRRTSPSWVTPGEAPPT